MWRRTTAESMRAARINLFAFILILISVAAFYPCTVQAACAPQNYCQNCTDDGRCITCRPFYGYQSRTGYCEPCGLDCAECTIGGNCTKCKAGYGPDFKSGNASCGQCSAFCGAGCNLTGPAKCDRCDQGYGLTTSGSCEACLRDNCNTGFCNVYGAGTCDTCDEGYGPNPSIIICTKCIEHCLSCPENISVCETCELGYSVFDPGNKSCGACSNYCTNHGCFYKGPGACDECDAGYFYYKNTWICGPCAANCSSCAVNGAGKCDNCTFGYGLTHNNTCEPCSNHCTTFGCNTTGAYNCTQCDLGFGLMPDGSCGNCSQNCDSCTMNRAGHCDNCSFGYGLTLNNTCAQCAANCSSCAVNGAGKCDNCTFGYELTSTNTCAIITTTPLSTTTPTPTTTADPGLAGRITSTNPANFGWDNYTATDNSNGSGGEIGGGYTVTFMSTTNNNGGLNSNYSVTPNTQSPYGDMDWRILLTFLMLIIGGIFITFAAILCWAMRFHPVAGGRTKRYRRRVNLLKES